MLGDINDYAHVRSRVPTFHKVLHRSIHTLAASVARGPSLHHKNTFIVSYPFFLNIGGNNREQRNEICARTAGALYTRANMEVHNRIVIFGKIGKEVFVGKQFFV